MQSWFSSLRLLLGIALIGATTSSSSPPLGHFLFGLISQPLGCAAHFLVGFVVPVANLGLDLLSGGEEGTHQVLRDIVWEFEFQQDYLTHPVNVGAPINHIKSHHGHLRVPLAGLAVLAEQDHSCEEIHDGAEHAQADVKFHEELESVVVLIKQSLNILLHSLVNSIKTHFCLSVLEFRVVVIRIVLLVKSKGLDDFM